MNVRQHRYWTWVAVLGAVLFCPDGLAAITSLPPGEKEDIAMPIIITSPSFKHAGMIPRRHTCDGLNISPVLQWTGVPAETKSLALIIDDPDAPDPVAPKMTWVHWIVYNIPPNFDGLPETTSAEGLPRGALQGLNDWQHAGYEGPCPPIGKHRYFFKLYALDIVLPDMKLPSRSVLESAMQGHILTHSRLIGVYERQNK
jgi:Raf kinase inhibitor-like YbhB/YbcL family protein